MRHVSVSRTDVLIRSLLFAYFWMISRPNLQLVSPVSGFLSIPTLLIKEQLDFLAFRFILSPRKTLSVSLVLMRLQTGVRSTFFSTPVQESADLFPW